jgi:hypothetical protein
VLTRQQLLHVLGPVILLGAKVEWWEEANGAAPAATTFDTGSKLKATFENLYHPMTMSQ